MDREEAIAVAEKFAEKVANEFHPRQILLFGSYLRGTQQEWSDIDIAILFDKDNEPENWWKAAVRMYKIRREINNFDIEPHLWEYPEKNDPADIACQVMKTGKVLYQKT